jgi:hypothetical protein
MLIVAGPKRMIQWAYVVGTYTAKFRKMWEETVDYIQKEVDEAGLDVKVPKELPTRANLNREITKVMKPVTAPVEEALKEVGEVKKSAVNGTRMPPLTPPAPSTPRPSTTAAQPAATTATTTAAEDTTSPEAPPAPPKDFGTWSGASQSQDREVSS